MPQLRNRLARDRAWQEIAVIACLCGLAGAFVWWFAVEVPVGDQWGEADILLSFREGRLTLAELLRQANESRPLFPRLAWLALSQVSGWSSRQQMFMTQAVLVIAAFASYLVARATFTGAPRTFVAIAGTLLLFTLTQYDNFFWGIQSIVCMPTLALLLALALIWNRPLTMWTVAGVCGLGTVATFSYANGMVCWPLLVIAVAFAPQAAAHVRGTGIAATMVCAAINIAIYFRGYARPGGHPSFGLVLQRPLDFLQSFLAYVGAAFAFEPRRWTSAVVIGALVCLLLAWSTIVILRAWRDTAVRVRAMPWLLLAAYGFGTGLITAAGRLGFGREYLLASRYAAFSSVLLIGTLGLVTLCLHRIWQRTTDPARALRIFGVGVSVATVFGTVYLLNAIDSFALVETLHRYRLRGQAILRFLDGAEENDVRFYVHWPGPEGLHERLPRLIATGLFRPVPPEVTWERPSTDRVGAVDAVRATAPGVYEASGWIYLRDQTRVPEAILVTDERQSPRRVLRIGVPALPREDVVVSARERAALLSGWRVTFTVEGDQPVLGFWAYDTTRGRAHALCPNPASCGAFDGVINGNLIERRPRGTGGP